MANKPKKLVAPEAEKFPRKEVPIYGKTKADGRVYFAKLVTSSELAAHRVINITEEKSGLGVSIDVPNMLEQLRNQAAAVNRGDLSEAEGMLMNQATALQSLFARLTERAMDKDSIPAFEAFMRMALRAQNQCRATLEALAEIKNPRPVAFVKQANIAHGPQQINNGVPVESLAHGKNPISSNELSGGSHELLPDTRASALESRIDTPVEAVGEIYRATD